jgi:phospholipid N-methyltransferase
MVAKIDPQPTDVIVELGPGTGVFTRELLSRGVDPANLILVEFNREFVKYLKNEFPALRIIQGAAQDMPQLLKALGQGPVKKIISGIPLRSMKQADCRQIAKSVAAVLEPGGMFVQFSYFKASPVPKLAATEAGLEGHCVGAAINNVPPAFVWQYIKNS